MNQLFYIALTMTIFSCMGVALLWVLSKASRAATHRVRQVTLPERRIQAVGSRRKTVEKRFFTTVAWAKSRMGATEDAKLLDRFARAGLRSRWHIDSYFAMRMLGPIVAAGAASFITSNRMGWMLALAGASYLAPDIALERRIKKRRAEIKKSVPDAIDLLVICVDAGLGMDQAMLRVGQELGVSHPQITEEFLQINREQRAGKLRIEAWQGMADRSKLPEIEAFVSMLMQTERFGTPIAKALSSFAEGIRLKRRQLAEEMAAKTTVKIIFPLVLFIFPNLFIVLLGPAALSIARGLSITGQ